MIEVRSFTAEELVVTDENVKSRSGLKFYSFKSEPFRIYGLYDAKNPERKHCIRMPQEVADNVNEGVKGLNSHTAGGRVRFNTTSRYIALFMKNGKCPASANASPIGKAGFDIYVRRGAISEQIFAGVVKPPIDGSDDLQGVVELPDGEKQVTVYLPIYSGTGELFIGLDENSALTRHEDYTLEKPVLFYGSSITQGASASRSGMAYEAIISRRLDINFINFGFSGNARGEDTIADYMASLDISAFVCDYDHNAPSVEHLQRTHERLYLKIRAAHPSIPVIFVTKPDFWLKNKENELRRDVIYNTYINAKKRGENVLFIDGYSLFAGQNREDCTADGCHPNDLGMFRMAEVIGKALEFALREVNV